MARSARASRRAVSNASPLLIPDRRSNQPISKVSRTTFEDCARCRLSEKRTTVVFGEGAPDARIMFVGEGPGAEEDRTGRPFVGQAGQLLDRMIVGHGLSSAPRPTSPTSSSADRPEIATPRTTRSRPARAFSIARSSSSDRMSSSPSGGSPPIDSPGTDKPLGALRGRWSHYKRRPAARDLPPGVSAPDPRGQTQGVGGSQARDGQARGESRPVALQFHRSDQCSGGAMGRVRDSRSDQTAGNDRLPGAEIRP